MRIKILECIRQGQIGGGETHLLSLVENLDKSKFEPVVLSFTEGPMIDRLKDQGIKTHVIHTEKPFDIFKWKQVKKLIKDEQIRLIHAHGSRALSNIFNSARALKIPLVYTIHGWSFHEDQHPIVKKIRIAAEKWLTAKTNVNISVSESNKRSGLQYFKFNSEVINNGIDQVKFDPDRKYKDIRTEAGIDKDAILVVFIARFTAHKQPLALLNAFTEASKKVPGLKLLMVGEGDQKEEALRIAADSGQKKNISFLPFRPDVPDILAASDIFVLPSLWEGLPIALLEAMSMKKAVIGTNVDGTSEVIQHHVNGLLIDSNNLHNELVDALVKLGKDEGLRKNLSENAKLTVANRFDAKQMTREIEAVYERLL